MNVADPPTIPHLLFEEPSPLIVLLVIGGLMLLVYGRREGDRRVVRAGLLMPLAAGLLYMLSVAVTTQREELVLRTRELLIAAGGAGQVTDAQVESLAAFFAPEAALVGPGGQEWASMSDVEDAMSRNNKRYNMTRHVLKDIKAEVVDDGQGRTVMDVQTRAEGQREMRILTRWLLTWARDGSGDWRITQVQWLDHPLGISPQPGMWR